LKYHGGAALDTLKHPNLAALSMGLANLDKHLENAKLFGLQPVVAVNKFYTDTQEELDLVVKHCASMGIKAAISEVWASGGGGALELAEYVLQATEQSKGFTPLYDWSWGVEKKIETIATKIYGAEKVVFQAQAQNDLKTIEALGFDKLPVCIAKTQKSLSDNPALIGRPTGFTLSVREIEIASGAGFLVPITGEMVRMPGLPEVPAAESIDIDEQGNIVGLF